MRRFQRRSGFIPRRGARRALAWTGGLFQGVALTANISDFYPLWDSADSTSENLQGHGTHQRTIVWLTYRPGSLAARGSLGWHVRNYTTDAAGAVPATLVGSPFDPFILDQELLDWGFVEMGFNTGTSVTGGNFCSIFRDVKSKRRISDTDTLGLTLESTVNVTVDVGFRTLMKLV